jgi:hypothetical protein
VTGDLPPRGNAQDFVRPFVITGGRTRAADESLRMETMVHAISTPNENLAFEHAQIVEACLDPRSIAELAADVGVPLGVMMVLVGDLVHAISTPNENLAFEHAQIVEACLDPRSIAELAADVGVPLGVMMVLVGDLVHARYLETTHSDPVELELDALTRMIERVRAL